MDSGLSTLRGSHGGYDSEQEVKGQEEEDVGVEVEERDKKKRNNHNYVSPVEENSHSEARQEQIKHACTSTTHLKHHYRSRMSQCFNIPVCLLHSQQRRKTVSQHSGRTAARFWTGSRLSPFV